MCVCACMYAYKIANNRKLETSFAEHQINIFTHNKGILTQPSSRVNMYTFYVAATNSMPSLASRSLKQSHRGSERTGTVYTHIAPVMKH